MEQKWQMNWYFAFSYGFVLNFQILLSLSSGSFACSTRCSGCLGFCRITSIVLFLLDSCQSICQICAHRTYSEKLCSEKCIHSHSFNTFSVFLRRIPAVIQWINLKLRLENYIWQEYFAWLDFILKLNSDSWNNSVNTGCITPKWCAQIFSFWKCELTKFLVCVWISRCLKHDNLHINGNSVMFQGWLYTHTHTHINRLHYVIAKKLLEYRNRYLDTYELKTVSW